MAQSEQGRIRLFDHFFNAVPAEMEFVETPIGPFRFFGEGADELDSGALLIAGRNNGWVRVTTTNEAAHSAAIGTQQCMEPAEMGTLIAECRIELNNLDTKNVFFGFSDDGAANAIEPVAGATTTLTLNDSDLVGFVLDHSLTEDEMWHFCYNGGTATGETDSTAVESGVDAVAGEADILRVEIAPNGTARWYINGELKKTLEGAVDPDVVFAAYAMVTADGAAVEEMDLDLLDVRANTDWTE